MSVRDAAEGSVEGLLVALKLKLAEAVDLAELRELPALAKQLVAIVDALDALPVKEGAVVDDIAARRAARRSAATG